MKAQHEEAIETINAEWQDYLCGLYAERGEEPSAEEPEEAPRDLQAKVGAIAQELFEINAGSTMGLYEDDDDEDETMWTTSSPPSAATPRSMSTRS